MLQRNIQVFYDGKFPNSCSGTLRIVVDGAEVYNKSFVCHSTGSVWFDKDWGEHVECGELVWREADQFDEEVQKAVAEKLSSVPVCCGGCV